MELGKVLAGADFGSRVLATKVGRVLHPVNPANAPQEEFWRSPALFRSYHSTAGRVNPP